MAFELPPLPYDRDALAPHISAETLEFHYGKHHQTYVTNLNNLTLTRERVADTTPAFAIFARFVERLKERSAYAEVRFHRLGQKQETDVLVREKVGNPELLQSAHASKDGHWLVVAVHHGAAGANDVFLRDLRQGDSAPFVPVVVDEGGLSTASPLASGAACGTPALI